ncbi:MAG: HDOD domain-containing protein, partial [Myxococcota bacterium]|nr:HDOD domain-containing protein [Myxococcota bacterium]
STAHACQAASRLISTNGNFAFLTGLLHKIGLMVHLINLPSPTQEPRKSQALWDALNISHPAISHYILSHWKMPNEILLTIGNYGQLLINDQLNELSALLLIAEEITRRIGYSHPSLTSKDSFSTYPQEDYQDAIQLLNLNANDLEKIMTETQNALRLTSRIV